MAKFFNAILAKLFPLMPISRLPLLLVIGCSSLTIISDQSSEYTRPSEQIAFKVLVFKTGPLVVLFMNILNPLFVLYTNKERALDYLH